MGHEGRPVSGFLRLADVSLRILNGLPHVVGRHFKGSRQGLEKRSCSMEITDTDFVQETKALGDVAPSQHGGSVRFG